MISLIKQLIIKNKRLSTKVQLFSIILFFFSLQANANNGTVEIVVDDFPPYINKMEDAGAVQKVVKAAFAQENITVRIEYLPWVQVEEQVDQNNRLSFMWSKTAERRRKWSYSEPVYVNRQVLVARKDKRVFWRRFDELRQYNIGVTTHHNYGKRFEEYRKYLTLTESISDFISLKKLINKQFDAVVLEELTARHLLRFFSSKKQAQIEILDHAAIDTSESYLVCSKYNAACSELIDSFNKGLLELKSNGQYKNIINKGN